MDRHPLLGQIVGPTKGISQPRSNMLDTSRYGALGMMVRSFRRSRLCSSTGGEMLADMVELKNEESLSGGGVVPKKRFGQAGYRLKYVQFVS